MLTLAKKKHGANREDMGIGNKKRTVLTKRTLEGCSLLYISSVSSSTPWTVGGGRVVTGRNMVRVVGGRPVMMCIIIIHNIEHTH